MENQNPNLMPPYKPPPEKAWYKRWYVWVAIGIGSTVFFGALGSLVPSKNSVEPVLNTTVAFASIENTTQAIGEDTTVKTIIDTTAEATIAITIESTEGLTSGLSREYENAMKSAESYLNYSGFSKEELYDQLIYEKYSEEAARYAVENVDTDWKENAVRDAESYLQLSSFSKQELYDQLIFEKYTPEEAKYAVDKVY